MVLKLLIKSGPQAGNEFELKAGVTLGRTDADISIDDAKISGQHAKIEKDPSGAWVISDLGSRNGIKIDGKRLAQVTLSAGLVLKIGNTDFEVISAPDPLIAAAPPPLLPLPPVPIAKVPAIPTAADPIPSKPPELPNEVSMAKTGPNLKTLELDRPIQPAAPVGWAEYLSQFAARSQKKVSDHSTPLAPFDPILVLSIIQGPQIGTEWTVGYGPRNVGLDTVDLPLFDSHAPGIAFTVTPKGPFALFETTAPKKVRLNNKSLSAETLRGDDQITIGDTVIRVSYRE